MDAATLLGMKNVILTVLNPSGLHARPAALFVKSAAAFAADVKVTNLTRDPGRAASAKSLLALLTLGVSSGHRIRLEADGPDADDAVTTLKELVEAGLGEVTAHEATS